MQGYKAPDGLKASTDMAEVVKHAELLLMVIPTPFVAATIMGIKDILRPEQVCLLWSSMSCNCPMLNAVRVLHWSCSRMWTPSYT